MMPDEVDRSILDRLEALRGGTSGPAAAQGPARVSIDLIERDKTPGREDALATRLKSLRNQAEPSPSPPAKTPQSSVQTPPAGQGSPGQAAPEDDNIDDAFQTDDQTLEDLLGDVGDGDTFAAEPDDARVKALLEELRDLTPREEGDQKTHQEKKKDAESDDSDGEDMKNEVDSVIARFRDEIQAEADLDRREESPPPEQDAADVPPADFSLPSVPSDAASGTKPSPSSVDDITARLSALRSSSSGLDLPSVPASRPSKATRRLQSRTNYADDDVDTWCTVCLEDATLLCLGCADTDESSEGDPYCARCWREMHIGPAAAFDHQNHRTVEFNRAPKRDKNKKVALGA